MENKYKHVPNSNWRN